MIILTLFFFLVAFLIMLRYRLHIKGLDECHKKGNKGILFLPNHPALIDPVILSRVLFLKFHIIFHWQQCSHIEIEHFLIAVIVMITVGLFQIIMIHDRIVGDADV